jgi:hypothetical protein
MSLGALSPQAKNSLFKAFDRFIADSEKHGFLLGFCQYWPICGNGHSNVSCACGITRCDQFRTDEVGPPVVPGTGLRLKLKDSK